ncbi:MAG TPA: hypothetical protein VFI64_03295 [Nitrososphaeraceae archaeon]|nr:hypothetical protein [Nitrososphaeraceae archaeon]
MVNLKVRGSTQKISLKVIGIVILLPNSPLLQKLYNVATAILVQVKISESVSSEETNNNVSATLTLAKATSVKRNNRDLTLHTANSVTSNGVCLTTLMILLYNGSKK